MALDTRYRPTRYSDVIGQEATTTMLKQLVRTGKGFHQSYLICGQWGSGKTTTGRILARSLLCEAPVDGEPCDACLSCREILTKGRSEAFTEFDAASNSGKDDLAKVIEENQYSTTSGKQRLYLIDEAHRLSKGALDILLKPMEDDRGGAKELVCIFCTTAPEKMAETVFSRCGPSFMIRVVPPEIIADRLAWICDQEGIPYERDALVAIAAVKESHIRDCLKAIDSLQVVGKISRETVNTYLHLDANIVIGNILSLLGQDLPSALREVDGLVQQLSPTTLYERFAATSMLAYKVTIGAAKAPLFWQPGLLEEIGKSQGDFLVTFAQRFASRPGHPTAAMLSLDLTWLHHLRSGTTLVNPSMEALTPKVSAPSPSPNVPSGGTPTTSVSSSPATVGSVESSTPATPSGSDVGLTTFETPSGRFIDTRGIRPKKHHEGEVEIDEGSPVMPDRFREFLTEYLGELRGAGAPQRSSGRRELGSPGTDSTG